MKDDATVSLDNTPIRMIRLNGKQVVNGIVEHLFPALADTDLPRRPAWLIEGASQSDQSSAAAIVPPPPLPGLKLQAPTRKMPARVVQRGSAVEHLAKEMVREFAKDPRCQAACKS